MPNPSPELHWTAWLSAVSACVAALGSLAAVVFALRTKWAERKASYYDRLVSDPISAQLESFEARLVALLPDHLERIYTALEANQPSKSVVEPMRREAVKAFQAAFRPLRRQLLGSAQHIARSAVSDTLVSLSESFEDDLVYELVRTTIATRGDGSIESICLEKRTQILDSVLAGDPLISGRKKPAKI